MAIANSKRQEIHGHPVCARITALVCTPRSFLHAVPSGTPIFTRARAGTEDQIDAWNF